MTIKQLRALSGLTQQAFGDYLNIPRRTIQSWEIGQRQCPEYLLDLIEYKLTNEDIIKKLSIVDERIIESCPDQPIALIQKDPAE